MGGLWLGGVGGVLGPVYPTPAPYPSECSRLLPPAPNTLPPQENQNEVVTVQGVSPDGRTLYLAAPLQFPHYGWAAGWGGWLAEQRGGDLVMCGAR